MKSGIRSSTATPPIAQDTAGGQADHRLGFQGFKTELKIERQSRWKNLTLVHLPTHTSWLNQFEIYFSIVQRKVLTPTTSMTSVCWHTG